MKKLYTIALSLLSLFALSQAPSTINYQGVARNANGSPIVGNIGVRVTIHVGSATGPSTLTETHNVNTNPFGIFDLRIGSNTTGGLSNIGWGAGPYWLGVAIDPAGGTNFGPEISTQQFVSVPYALYAEKSGSNGPGGNLTASPNVTVTSPGTNSFNISVPNYVAGPNVTITPLTGNNYEIISQGGGSPSGSLTASPNVTVTSPGTNSFNINVPNYVAGSNVTITPLAGNNYQINAGGASTMTPIGPWTAAGGSVYLTNALDNVGIGVNPFMAKLDVVATSSTGIFVSSPFNGILAVTSSSSPSNCAIYGNNQGGNTSGPAIAGVNSASTAAAISGTNAGTGPGVYGVHQNNINSPTAHGVFGETNSSSPTAAGVIGVNNGPGPGVYGYQGSASGGPGVWGIGNSANAAAIHGIHNNGYASIFGDNGTSSNSAAAYGVWGRTNSTNSLTSGVYGQNLGAGHGIQGIATANTFSVYGILGRNVGLGGGIHGDCNSTNVLVAGVSALNNGMGPALKGTLPPGTFAGASNAALLIENGHIKSTGAMPATNTVAVSLGGFQAGAVIAAGSTDTKGVVTVTTNVTGGVAANNFVDINIVYNKPFTAGATVIVTPYETHGMSYMVISMTSLNFQVRIKNNSGVFLNTGSTVPANAFRFSYMVME